MFFDTKNMQPFMYVLSTFVIIIDSTVYLLLFMYSEIVDRFVFVSVSHCRLVILCQFLHPFVCSLEHEGPYKFPRRGKSQTLELLFSAFTSLTHFRLT